MKRTTFLIALAALAVACGPSASGFGSFPVPSGPAGSGVTSSSPSAAPGGPLSQPQLKVRLIDRFGPLWYCDPDFYPIARDDEGTLAVAHWPEVTADPVTLAAITAHLGIQLSSPSSATDDQKLAIYREWKMLRAIVLDPVGSDHFTFTYLARPAAGAREGTRSTGTIDTGGTITMQGSSPAPQPNCPICLARGQRIDGPGGARAVESLHPGDLVWSLDQAGQRKVASVLLVAWTPVPAGHEVVQLALSDGRTMVASPGHPLADGRRLGDLVAGDAVQGSTVASASRVAYDGDATFDILVSGPTGHYSIDGIWLTSTLAPLSR